MNAKRCVASILIGVGCVAAILASFHSPVFPAQADSVAGDQQAVVSVLAPGDFVPSGSVFTVAIRAAHVIAPLSAFQFDLAYDPAVADLLYADAGPFLSATGREVVCPGLVEPAGGMARLACASTGQPRGATGEDTLAVLTFRAVGVGTSPLTLSNVQLPDDGRPPTLAPATLQNNVVTVESAGFKIFLPMIRKDPTTLVQSPVSHAASRVPLVAPTLALFLPSAQFKRRLNRKRGQQFCSWLVIVGLLLQSVPLTPVMNDAPRLTADASLVTRHLSLPAASGPTSTAIPMWTAPTCAPSRSIGIARAARRVTTRCWIATATA
jgi:hypothetical protein